MADKFSMRTILLFLFCCLVFIPFNLRASEELQADLSKTQAYMGDPSQKRGFELGYDHGVKEGKKDQAVGPEQKPTEKEAYKTADKQYRYEYGSRARFVAGYRAGYTKGYKSGYSRAKDIAEGKRGPTETLPGKKKLSTPKKAEVSDTDIETEKYPKNSADFD